MLVCSVRYAVEVYVMVVFNKGINDNGVSESNMWSGCTEV